MIRTLLSRLLTPSAVIDEARRLYDEAVKQARQPELYQRYGVADTVDGRFDLIALHVFLRSRALARSDMPQAAATRQQLINQMITDMDLSLREMGIGDMSIGKKVQKAAYALNGRFETYEAAWDEDEALRLALWRNVYRGDETKRDYADMLLAYSRGWEANKQPEAA